MVVKKSKSEKKETRRARDRRYYEKNQAAKPKAVKPKVDLKLSNRRYYQKKHVWSKMVLRLISRLLVRVTYCPGLLQGVMI
jgi:hypothetical protein